MRVKVEKEKCSGCHLCQVVCSLLHAGAVNIEKSAIRIDKDDLGSSLHSPVLCRQCKEMKCLQGEEAIEARERQTFVWKRDRASRCPFDALPVLGEHAYHCHLCGGHPQCIKVCTPKAIRLAK